MSCGCGVRSADFVVIDESNKQSISEKGQPGGYAGLDATGHVPAANLNISGFATEDDVTAAVTVEAQARGTAIQTEAKARADGDAAVAAEAASELSAAIQTEVQRAEGLYVKEAELNGLVRESERDAAGGFAGLDANGKVATGVVPYVVFGVFPIAVSNFAFDPALHRGRIGRMDVGTDCDVHISLDATKPGAKPGDVIAFFKTGGGRLTFSLDAGVTLLMEAGFSAEATGLLVTLTCLAKDVYALVGKLKAAQ